MERVRKHYIITGYVQGVGFRWRTYHAARRFGITGWIRNLDDGSVELEAEGTAADLSGMIEILEQSVWGSISDIREHTIPVQNDRDFAILG